MYLSGLATLSPTTCDVASGIYHHTTPLRGKGCDRAVLCRIPAPNWGLSMASGAASGLNLSKSSVTA
jgi:hypothetical protein